MLPFGFWIRLLSLNKFHIRLRWAALPLHQLVIVAAHLEASLIELEIAPADIETILAAVGDTADQFINA